MIVAADEPFEDFEQMKRYFSFMGGNLELLGDLHEDPPPLPPDEPTLMEGS